MLLETFLSSQLVTTNKKNRHNDSNHTDKVKNNRDSEMVISFVVIMAILLTVLALLRVKHTRNYSITPGADVIVAIGSPITYFLLSAIGLLSTGLDPEQFVQGYR